MKRTSQSIFACMALSIYYSVAWNPFSSQEPAEAAPTQKAEHIAPTEQVAPPECLSLPEQKAQNRFTCPQPDSLYKDGMRWKSGNGWKSNQESFSDSIAAFMGAQWNGVGVGTVICIYKPSDTNDFPIQLANTALVQEPNTAYWEAKQEGQVINCVSRNENVCDCQFSLYTEKAEEDVNEIISSIKKQ